MPCGSNIVVFTGISLAAFLCTQRGAAQITIGNVVTAPDLTQPVAGDCANYDSILSSTGVSVNGQTHPGRCRSSAITPLFDGAPLGSNMQAFLNSHRGLFTVKAVPGRVGCETVSKITVALSASLQATRLEWTGAPVMGAKCSNEVARVNAASTVMASPAYIRGIMTRLLQGAEREVMATPQPSACGRSPAITTRALNQQVWNLLQKVANDEVRRFEASVAPAIDNSSSCAAKCNLCFSGWVGSIQCTATANDPNYQWHEVQTWDVGGASLPGVGGGTVFPAAFVATGSGSKTNGPSWSINAATTGTFNDAGVNANKRFSTSNDTVAGGITWGNGSTNSVSEMQVKFNADQVGGSTATNDPTATIPGCINAQQKPAAVSCSVSCTWDLLQQ